MLLYPVRAIKKYLDRTGQCHPACSSLFISMTKRKKRLSQGTISFRIRSVIAHAYKSAIDENCRAVKVKVDKVHKIGTLFLFRINCAVPEVLEVGTWSFQTTFPSFY